MLRSISLVEVLEEVLLVHLALHDLALVSGPHGQLEKKRGGCKMSGVAQRDFAAEIELHYSVASPFPGFKKFLPAASLSFLP